MTNKNNNSQGSGMSVEEAGRKGGEQTARTHGHEFYSEIGRKGGEKVAEERGPEFYSEIGRKGGETVAEERGPEFYSEIGRKGGEKVSSDREHMSEIGRKGGERRGGSVRPQAAQRYQVTLHPGSCFVKRSKEQGVRNK